MVATVGPMCWVRGVRTRIWKWNGEGGHTTDNLKFIFVVLLSEESVCVGGLEVRVVGGARQAKGAGWVQHGTARRWSKD